MTAKILVQRFLLALALLALATGSALAQRNRAKKEDNPYPNATRESPEPKTSSAYDKVQRAYDLLGKDEYDGAKVNALLTEVAQHKRATDYERALAYRGMAQIALDADDIPAALANSRKALETNALDNPSHFDTLYLIAQISINDEKYTEALSAIDEWMKLSGAQKAEAWAMRGNALYRLERYPEAAESLKKAIGMAEKPQPSWQQLLIATYNESGDTAGAAAAAEAALAKNPDDKSAILLLAEAYIDSDQTDKAAKLLDDAYRRGLLDDEKTLVYLASLLSNAEQPKRAAEILGEAMAKGKVQPTLDNYKRLGNFHYEAEQVDGAIEAYAKGAALSQDGELDYQRAHLLLQEKEQVAEGKRAIEQAIAKGNFKQMGEAYILLGNAELELGNEAAAIAAYKKAQGYPSTKSMADQMLKNFRR